MANDVAPEQLDAALSLLPERPEQRLITYRVRRGDTLTSVARRYRSSADAISELNRLRNRKLFVGQRLNIAVAAPARTAAVQKTASRAR
jgi:membrane-bound lytic murein transglycosylase D